jgi:hypothetical protein
LAKRRKREKESTTERESGKGWQNGGQAKASSGIRMHPGLLLETNAQERPSSIEPSNGLMHKADEYPKR